MIARWCILAAMTATAAVAAIFLGAAETRAHSFQAVFVAPMSGAEAAAGKAALDGFMVATRERDGHPDETADGHLGGLDVHVTVVDTGPGPAAAVERVRSAQADIVAGLMTPEIEAAIRGATNAIPVGPDSVASDARTMDGQPFADAFRAEYGYRASPAAITGYRQARRIDRAIRAVDGDVGDRAALAAALAGPD